ncbi:MAG: DUF5110 domain-containing protein [Chloroflexi bacterium]|nr:DUF5110 domain-containing protein [Chloroflexota bacterium]
MPDIAPHFQIPFAPLADPNAMISGPQVRFTVLTSRLIRLEYHPDGTFEDRPTQVFWYRQQPVPVFQAAQDESGIEIETEHLHLRYRAAETGFQPENLSITLKESGTVWRFADLDTGNLRGTTRTLDQADGYVPLEPGLVSRDGWVVVDDSRSLAFTPQGWLEPRGAHPGALDLYFFGYGHDYRACQQDYGKIAGTTPMIPRWILGNWWSRYWAYQDTELLNLMDDFKAHDIPLAVCIVDMDWHITQTGNACTGWTGYTWNRTLFPDPDGFIQALHTRGLRTALNLHPAEGVHPHEEQYPAMAERLGIDPASEQPVLFDIADPVFMSAYFEVLHHPLEKRGIDFWWLDWQQGEKSFMPGLDPLRWLNHLHYYDLGRDGQNRPFIFSRWGGLGNHRYPIGFSGDSIVSWDTLAFQPYLTATAANVSYGWWSHDIGGHFGGVEEPELYTRWVQFGAFSPILRLHSTSGVFYERRPWGFDNEDVLSATRDAMQLRHALIPYLYSMAWRNTNEGLTLIQPMYYEYPDADEAYACPQQYLFGDQLIAAPFTSPIDPATRLARQVVWLPEGDWYHFFNGEQYDSGWHAIYGRLADIPVFAKAGAIVLLAPKVTWGGLENPDVFDVHLFAGADGRFSLYEDDGETAGAPTGSTCLTEFTQAWAGHRLDFQIAPVSGDPRFIPAQRTIRLHIHGVLNPKKLRLEIGGAEQSIPAHYEAARETLHLDPVQMPVNAGLRLSLSVHAGSLLARRDRTSEKIVELLRAFKMNSNMKESLNRQMAEIHEHPERLADFEQALSDSQRRALFEILCQAGIHHVRDTRQADLVVVWNNRENAQIDYLTAFDKPYEWRPMMKAESGRAPRFKAIIPAEPKLRKHGFLQETLKAETWQVSLSYFNQFVVSYNNKKE